MPRISANSVLPARRRRVGLTSSDALVLRGELATPRSCEPVATLVCVHPLTTHGGSMESHLLRKISWRLPALAGLAVLRFNMRGAGVGEGRSDGEFDAGRGEGLDLGAALAFCADEGLPEPWLVGWSFGGDLALKFGDRPPVAGAVLLSPPLRYCSSEDLTRWASSRRAVVALVPELDRYRGPEEVRRLLSVIPQARVIVAPGAEHLWVGERFVRIALNEIVNVVVPAAYPLPDTWAGPMERWNDL